MTRRTSRKRDIGQALVEFAFTLPILILFIAGVFDFGRVFFVYAQASNNVRRAVREAPVIGYSSATTPGYLDCENMISIAENVIAADGTPSVTVEYFNDLGGSVGTCVNNGDITDSDVDNGYYLQVSSTAQVTPVLLAFIGQSFTFDIHGQRTIIKSFAIGATDCALTWPTTSGYLGTDDDYDGLCDDWELFYWGHTNQIATDNPDGDACNNGCEEESIPPGDPTVP